MFVYLQGYRGMESWQRSQGYDIGNKTLLTKNKDTELLLGDLLPLSHPFVTTQFEDR
jgi:hypothetical protein